MCIHVVVIVSDLQALLLSVATCTPHCAASLHVPGSKNASDLRKIGSKNCALKSTCLRKIHLPRHTISKKPSKYSTNHNGIVGRFKYT